MVTRYSELYKSSSDFHATSNPNLYLQMIPDQLLFSHMLLIYVQYRL